MKLMFNTPTLSTLAAACARSSAAVVQRGAAGSPVARISAQRPQGLLSTVHAQRGVTPATATIALTDSKAMSKGALGFLNRESKGYELGGFRGIPPRGKPV